LGWVPRTRAQLNAVKNPGGIGATSGGAKEVGTRILYTLQTPK